MLPSGSAENESRHGQEEKYQCDRSPLHRAHAKAGRTTVQRWVGRGAARKAAERKHRDDALDDMAALK